MADTKLADLTALTTTSDDDLLYVVDDPAGTPADRKLALSNVFKRGTVTTSSPVIDAAQTWNASGVTFTGLKFNATDTASAAGSLLMDLQVGGTSQFSVRKNGDQFFSVNRISFVGTTSTQEFQFAYNNSSGNAHFSFRASSAPNLRAVAQAELTWVASTTTVTAQSPDTILTRRAAANLRLGAADTGATTSTVTITIAAPGVVTWSSHGFSTGTPVVFTTTGALPTGITAGTTYYAVVVDANTFQIASSVANAIATPATVITTSGTQSGTHTGTRYNITQRLGMQSVTGVTDRLGADLVIQGSQGTGTGAGGSIIFQVAPAGTTGSAQNALATALTIDGTRKITFADAGAQAYIDSIGRGSFYSGRFTAGSGFANPWVTIADNTLGVNLADAAPLSWCNNASAASGTADVILRRDTSNTLALRNANNGQTFRIYGRFTDITNDFERFFINAPTTSGAAVQLGTQKGATTGAARALEFQTDGTTRLTIGSAGGLTLADAQDIAVGSTTGTKIGTATTQKIGFYNKAPVVQPTAVADATDAATVITQLNALLSRMRDLGLIAT